MGAPIYSSLGFQTVGMTRVWKSEVNQAAISKQLESLCKSDQDGNQVICPVESSEDWEKVYQITKKSFYNAERKIILKTTGYGPTSESKIHSIGSIPLTCLITSKDGEPQAFGVIRPFPFPTSTSQDLKNSELRINLIVASSSHPAKLVTLNLLKGLPEGTKIKVEVQLENDGEEETEWKKNQGQTKLKGSLRQLLNEMGWENNDGNKIMIYKCGKKEGENEGEKRWEQGGSRLRQFCPFDAL